MMSLHDWLTRSCATPGVSDEHIDYFDARWKDRTRWLQGGEEVLQDALEKAMTAQCSRSLAMVYTLNSSLHALGVLATKKQFEELFDHSPPCLFIAEQGSEPWITSRTHEHVEMWEIPNAVVKNLFYMPFRCAGLEMLYWPGGNSEEATRSVWFACSPRELGRNEVTN
jgi:hypothetical protein